MNTMIGEILEVILIRQARIFMTIHFSHTCIKHRTSSIEPIKSQFEKSNPTKCRSTEAEIDKSSKTTTQLNKCNMIKAQFNERTI